MIGLALSLMLSGVPSLGLDVPRSAHLLAQADTALVPAATNSELDDLLARPVPSLGGPIGLVAGGAGLSVAGGLFLYYGAITFFLTGIGGTSLAMASIVFFVLGGLCLVPGVVMLIIGIKGLTGTLRERRERSRRIKALQNERRAPTPGSDPMLPPPPLPPPSVELGPTPALLLAEF